MTSYTKPYILIMTSTDNDVIYKHTKYIHDVIILNPYNDVSGQK